MAKTIFDTPAPRAARSLTPFIGAMPPEPAEKVVAAEPPLGRAAVLYMEAREGIDGPRYYNSCASCSSFVPESMMRGAVRGDRCAKFGSGFPVTDDSSCNAWTPWSDGKPCGECQAHAAEKIIKGSRGALNPYNVGFVDDKKRTCGSCRQFSVGLEGGGKCALLAKMDADMPTVFALGSEVKSVAKCNLWNEYPPPEPMS